ncbi:DUF3857 domain-containing protein [Fabibacter sp. E12]|nr:DUF3857 domain-containing protein [Roseivirga sp. E12]
MTHKTLIHRSVGVILLLLIQFTALSQNRNFGFVSDEELKLKTYAADKEAEAVILFDKGKSTFKIDREKGQFNIIFTRTKRIKILKTSGQARGDINIYFFRSGYNREQLVYDIKATAYNWDDTKGQIKNELSEKDIYEEQLGNELWTKKFVIPNVKVGSVIEYQYTLEIPRSNNIPDWEFQSDLPTVYSEYEVGIIPFYEYTYLLQGKTRFDYTSNSESKFDRTFADIEFKDVNYKFAMKNLSAFNDESFITSKSDYIVKMDWQLTKIYKPDGTSDEFMTTWPQLSKELLAYDSYGKFIQKSSRSAKKIFKDELKVSSLTPIEKAQKITDYVKNRFSWNGYFQKYTELSTKEFMALNEGSTAEINLFLAGLLQAAGLNAKAVLISTRSHGKIIKTDPFESFFNSSIVLLELDGRSYLLDATEPLLPFGWIPAQCINEQGLVITKEGELWVNLSTEPLSSIQEELALSIDLESNLVVGDFKRSMTGYDALIAKKDPDFLKEALESYNLEGEIIKSEISQRNKAFTINYSASAPGIDRFGDLINIRPFLNKPWGSNPLKAKSRSYPVDLIYKRHREYISTLSIPEGFQVLSKPENLLIDNGLIKIDYQVQEVNNALLIQGKYIFKKSVYDPKEYKQIRQHIDQFVDKFNELVVLKKIE